jgi:hypothetical protein
MELKEQIQVLIQDQQELHQQVEVMVDMEILDK